MEDGPGLYTQILVPVLEFPAVEEGRLGGLPNLLKEEEKEEDVEEEKEDGEEEEDMKCKRWDEEEMQDSLVVVEVHKDPTSCILC